MKEVKKAYIIGTCDTKYPDLAFVRDILKNSGVPTVLVDVSTRYHRFPVDVSAEEVASHHPLRKELLTNNKGRGDAVTAISEALVQFMLLQHEPGGVIGLGGSGGTALITPAMQALPVGIPKIMVSTVASGDTRPYVGVSDIMMVYSVTDISGINQISNIIYSNAANSLLGMMKYPAGEFQITKPALGLTMFGVTTPCIEHVKQLLAEQFDCLVFHATGTGGRSMEKLIDSGFIKHAIDITTTEIADLIAGGVMSAGESRLDAVISNKIPYVGSTGALDMVNFGALDSVPNRYKDRLLYQHNAQVTLMRTSVEENVQIGNWLAGKLNQMKAPVRFFIPEGGNSLMSEEGHFFHDPEADRSLIETLEKEVKQSADLRLIRLPMNINQKEFASEVVASFYELQEL